jgi:ribonuclease D
MRKAREIAVLMEVAAWREREAQTRDVPRGRVLKDETVIDVAVSAPRSVEALGRLRSIPTGFERSKQAGEILAAVERGLARDPKTVPVPERARHRQSTGAIVELLKVLLKAVSEAEGVAPKIIATVDDLEAIAENDNADVGPLRGWRRQLFGEKALALKHGELGLSVRDGRVLVTAVRLPEPAETVSLSRPRPGRASSG